jgi:hypothetical protein
MTLTEAPVPQPVPAPAEPPAPAFKIPELYNPRQPCLSCGHGEVESRFCETSMRIRPSALACDVKSPEVLVARCFIAGCYLPHIHRDCRRCGRAYVQRPLDSLLEHYEQAAIAARRARFLQAVKEQIDEVLAPHRKARAAAEASAAAEDERERRRGRRWWL